MPFLWHPPLSSSPQLWMSESTLGGVIDGNIWEHCLQNTKGICVYQKRSEHPHSIMWQSNQASRGASLTTAVVKLLKAFNCTVQLQISFGWEYIEVKYFQNNKQNTTFLHHYADENIHTHIHTQYIQWTQSFELMLTVSKKQQKKKIESCLGHQTTMK